MFCCLKVITHTTKNFLQTLHCYGAARQPHCYNIVWVTSCYMFREEVKMDKQQLSKYQMMNETADKILGSY